jgi:3-dehydroquinate synthase
VDRQRKLLEAFRLPAVRRTFGGSPDALIAIMLRDKKTVDGMLRFVLPSGIGRVELVAGVDAAAVRRVLS